MKHRHLQKLGYTLVVVPYWEWSELESVTEKQVALCLLSLAALCGCLTVCFIQSTETCLMNCFVDVIKLTPYMYRKSMSFVFLVIFLLLREAFFFFLGFWREMLLSSFCAGLPE